MPAPDKSGFRITAWPDRRLPHPPQLPWTYELNDDALIPVARPESGDARTDSAGETYLRLRALALDDPKEILAFANGFGTLGLRAAGFAGIGGIPGRRLQQRREAAEESLRNARQRQRGGLAAEGVPDAPLDVWGDRPPLAETLAEFRLAADYLADLTDLWRFADGLKGKPDLRVLDKRTVFGDRFGAARNLEEGLAAALKPFHPRVMVSATGDARDAAATAWVAAPLFSVCALELFNHIAERAEYRQCANDSCQRLFVRQEGRARYGQHRTEGVRFCSVRCLRAQKQRDYRARLAGSTVKSKPQLEKGD